MSDLTFNRYSARGTKAEREAFNPDPPSSMPGSEPTPAHRWFETDTHQEYVWDGTEWVAVASADVPPPPSGVTLNTFVVSGGQVVWEADYDFRVSAAVYYINGVRYESAEQTVTLDAADGALDRLDVIALDTAGSAENITGTASATPSEPSVDPAAYVKLAIVLVTAASTEPAGATNVLLYAENAGDPAEWDWTASGASIVVNSTNNPHAGTIDIEGTNVVAGVYAQGEKGSGTIDPNEYDHLLLFIRSKASWNNNRGLLVTLRNAGVLVGAAVQIRRRDTFGFDSTITGSYQQVAIPLTAFAIPSGSVINQVRFEDFGGAIGFYIDDVSFQVGASTPATGGLTQAQADARYAPLVHASRHANDGADPFRPDVMTLRTSAPSPLADDMVWYERSGSGPYEISLNVRIAGTTHSIPLYTTA